MQLQFQHCLHARFTELYCMYVLRIHQVQEQVLVYQQAMLHAGMTCMQNRCEYIAGSTAAFSWCEYTAGSAACSYNFSTACMHGVQNCMRVLGIHQVQEQVLVYQQAMLHAGMTCMQIRCEQITGSAACMYGEQYYMFKESPTEGYGCVYQQTMLHAEQVRVYSRQYWLHAGNRELFDLGIRIGEDVSIYQQAMLHAGMTCMQSRCEYISGSTACMHDEQYCEFQEYIKREVQE